jgi:hypothetical protein
VADISEEARQEAAAEGDTAYGESFPIRNCDDLSNAIQAYGRAPIERRAELRRFIVRRKAELGCPDVRLPESWRIVRGEN